jgi:hypothetical protein
MKKFFGVFAMALCLVAMASCSNKEAEAERAYNNAVNQAGKAYNKAAKQAQDAYDSYGW